MAKVQVQVAGGEIKQVEASDLQSLKDSLGASDHVANVNGEPQTNGYTLRDFDFVSLAKAVKAGQWLEMRRGNLIIRKLIS